MTMMKWAAPALIALSAQPASAEALSKVPAQLNPAKAYVLVEYELMDNALKSLPGSRSRLPLIAGLALARYDAELKDVRGLGRAASNPVPKGQQAQERFKSRVLARTETSRMLLLELEPDLWVVQGYGNTSFSLGSLSFRLEPGIITDLGVVSAAPDWAEDQRAMNGGDLVKMAFLGPFAKKPDVAPMRASFRPRTDKDLPIPAGLPKDKVQAVAFMPDAKFGNYLGGLVNRIDGVNFRMKQKKAEAEAPAAN